MLFVRFDRERLTATTRLGWPSGNVIAGFAAANAWNGMNEAYSTSSYYEEDFLMLTSHLYLRGGVGNDHVVEWLREYLARINPWQTVAQWMLDEIGDDSTFDATVARSKEGWEILGKFTAGVVQQFLAP